MQLITNHPESDYFSCLIIGNESLPWNSSYWDFKEILQVSRFIRFINFDIL